MYQIIDTHTGRVIFEALSERTAQIRLNALWFTTQYGPDRDRYELRITNNHPLVAFFNSISRSHS